MTYENWCKHSSTDEESRKTLYDRALVDYNEAYYRYVFGPERDCENNKLALEKMRKRWMDA